MPLDAITITALASELRTAITGVKIDKVQQPERDTIVLSLRGSGQSSKLLLSAGTGTARVHISTVSYENPQSPPMFCMLLRKHLIGARIAGISQPEGERMLCFELDAFDEMGVEVKKRLIIEMMGRNSNIILVGEEGHVIDCLRRVDGDMSRARQVMPGLIYRLPPKQEKPDFLTATETERAAMLENADGDMMTDKWLLSSFSGISPLICRELSFRAAKDVSVPLFKLSAEDRALFLKCQSELVERVREGSFQPTMLFKEGKPFDFSFMPILQYEGAVEQVSFSGFSPLLEEYYTRRAKREHMQRKAHSLHKLVSSAHERTLRKLAARQQELLATENREQLKLYGELITANIYKMKKGDRVLIAENYYEQGSPAVEIPLDPLKTPQQNAARYFRDYNKAKTAEQYLGELIAKGKTEEAYLSSVKDAIERAESERELAEIRNELISTGFLKKQKDTKAEKIKETPFLCFYSSSGMPIYVGRNNTQNDRLTTKTARRSDLWLHVKDVHGSHVIISCGGEQPDEQSIFEAATLAAYFSQARGGGKVSVDYTQVCHVKKPSGSMPGMVTYTDSRTIIVEPDEKLVESLKSN